MDKDFRKWDEEISAEEKKFWKNIFDAVESAADEDYEVNQEQMAKFYEVVEFFRDAAKASDGAYLDPVELSPKMMHGGLDAHFWVFSLNGELDVRRFEKVLKHMSAISFDANTEGMVGVSVTVPNVFVRKVKA